MGIFYPGVDTETIKIGHKKYCAYCGKIANTDTSYDEYTPYYYYNCNCETAQQEIKMNEEIKAIRQKYNLKKLGHEEIQKLKYNYEMEQLKVKYNMK